MTHVFITVDTEYSSGLYTGRRAADRRENFARSIACITPQGPAGITHKLDLLHQTGQKAVFFVDPMPALVWGIAAIEDVIGPILAAGQEIQLHCHTEWLEHAGADTPLASGATGKNLFEFSFEDQCAIIDYARSTLIAAGAPAPIAFRAGNYGANNDTLRALAAVGLAYDSSHCPALVDSGACRIGLPETTRDPVGHMGVIEVPVGTIATLRGGLRHAQITALTLGEMLAAIRHARKGGRPDYVLVSHSFELVNRRTQEVNHIVRRRFAGLLKAIAAMHDVETGNFATTPPAPRLTGDSHPLLPASAMRTGRRMAEQFVSNALYGAL